MDITYNDFLLTVLIIYTPTSNYEQEQITTLKGMYSRLQDFELENVTIRGDFNMNLNPQLDRPENNVAHRDNKEYREEIHSLLEQENLSDPWRI